MKKTLLLFCIAIIAISISNAQSIFEKENIKQVIDKVNNYQFNNPWTQKADFNWISGTYYSGVMACY